MAPQLIESGVDMLNKTPIYDIKPYLSYTDSHPEAVCGFADEVKDYRLEVVIPENVSDKLGESSCDELRGCLHRIQDRGTGMMNPPMIYQRYMV